MAFSITNIPTIMRHNKWANGARLMEIWFSNPAAIAPNYGPPETQTIRMMAWALTFPRARQVFDELIRNKIWCNSAAQKEIAFMLRRKGLLNSTPSRKTFGRILMPAQILDADYVNQRVVSFGVSDLDDMSAALGNFVFRVVVAGEVTPIAKSSRHRVTILEIGVCIRDTYDFNGSQFLGFWDDKDNSVSMLNPLSGSSVSNEDFCKWRTKTGKGGDFLIFSDVHRIRLANPDIFDI